MKTIPEGYAPIEKFPEGWKPLLQKSEDLLLDSENKYTPAYGDGVNVPERYLVRLGSELQKKYWPELSQKNDEQKHSGSKYLRNIKGVTVDIYDVLTAFDVHCPARQHAIKKLLCAGIRGKGDESQDLNEALDAVKRAIELSGTLPKT